MMSKNHQKVDFWTLGRFCLRTSAQVFPFDETTPCEWDYYALNYRKLATISTVGKGLADDEMEQPIIKNEPKN